MKPADRARLTSALRDHVAKVAEDLRGQMEVEGPVRERAKRLHSDEQVGEDFDVWTDLLARRSAVLWILKSVYVRVLEDRGLLSPGRILDVEAQQLFEQLAPNLGENTAFLRWVYRDLASAQGGLPELFARQPAEIAWPSDALSRDLIAFWRYRDPDSGARWSFSEEQFEGELMGDLYQDLDPVVKDRFALCQTPDFVREFILERTLTPAIDAFGAENVRLIDPACGSGHFLIDALKRLVAVSREDKPSRDRRKLVSCCLERIVGIDLNDYACALARARLVMTAAELAGVKSLGEASLFHPQVFWADALEQVEKGEDSRGHQLDLLDCGRPETPRASLTRPEVRVALRGVLTPRFHAVVGNPPYIAEADEERKRYQRERVGGRKRYVTAHREYSLVGPFIERSLQLSVTEGFVGLIAGNNFAKREFGKPVVERVLAATDLTLLADTSQARIPHHGTPTVLLFCRARAARGETTRVVRGRRGDTQDSHPSRAGVWNSLLKGWQNPGFEDEFVSVADVARETLAKHPWTLAGGGAAELRGQLELIGTPLAEFANSMGAATTSGEDSLFHQRPGVLARVGVSHCRSVATGSDVRDWCITPRKEIVWPNKECGEVLPEEDARDVLQFFRPFKEVLRRRKLFKVPIEKRGLKWWQVREVYPERFATAPYLMYAEVASHNHFALVLSQQLASQTAPIVSLHRGASRQDHLAILGSLNSSLLEFWMRQVYQVKGGDSTGRRRQSEAWSRRHARDVTKLKKAPLPPKLWPRIAGIAERIHDIGAKGAQLRPARLLAQDWSPEQLRGRLVDAESSLRSLRQEQVALQEELDWTLYVAFGLAPQSELLDFAEIEPLASEHRPFAICLARRLKSGHTTSFWFEALGLQPAEDIPEEYRRATCKTLGRRVGLIESDDTLRLLETREHKRKWEPLEFQAQIEQAAADFLTDRIEQSIRDSARPVPLSHTVGQLQDDARFLAVASVYQGRPDVDVAQLVAALVKANAVPSHPFLIYTDVGLVKREAWDRIRASQDGRTGVASPTGPPEYSQGSRGKSKDFMRAEYWKIRGKLDVPTERFVGFTEAPEMGSAKDTLYGWAGASAIQRLTGILSVDEELEDAGVTLADRVALLDSAWRLLPDAAREDAAAASRLKAELQALVGTEGPSREMLDDWRSRFASPRGRGNRSDAVAKTESSRKKNDAKMRKSIAAPDGREEG